MRYIPLALVAAALLWLPLCGPAAAEDITYGGAGGVTYVAPAGVDVAQEFEIGPGGVQFDVGGERAYHRHHHGYHKRYGYGGECSELRAACLHKEELGEEGMGNCRRYRQMCGR